jgi:hypothetical protein
MRPAFILQRSYVEKLLSQALHNMEILSKGTELEDYVKAIHYITAKELGFRIDI